MTTISDRRKMTVRAVSAVAVASGILLCMFSSLIRPFLTAPLVVAAAIRAFPTRVWGIETQSKVTRVNPDLL